MPKEGIFRSAISNGSSNSNGNSYNNSYNNNKGGSSNGNSSSNGSNHHIDTSQSSSSSLSTDQDSSYPYKYKPNNKKLGTLNGVLLPTLQTILGVILFLRLPSITAQAGVIHTTIIIFICVTSTLITAISLSAIATNGTICAGGPYYVISRTLGLEVGGALGLLYYLGTTMACAMSVLGGVEAVLRSVGDPMAADQGSGGGVGGGSSAAEVVEDVLGDIYSDPDMGMSMGMSSTSSADGLGLDLGLDLARRFLQQSQSSFQDDNFHPIEIGPGDPIVNEIAEEVEMEIDYQFENSFLVQVGSHYLSFIVAFLLTIFVSVGFRVVDMASNLFLAVMFLSLFCSILGCLLFALGYHVGDLIPWDRLYMDNVWPNYTPDPNTGIQPDFFSCLALFYPSVTGILSGSQRSEFLAEPFKSIPNGTIGAVLISTSIYVLVVWLFGLTIANYTLKTNKFILAAVAFPQDQVVKVGVIVSCIGAAMQYMTQNPQLLSAIAMDDSMPILSFIKKGHNEDGINRRALWFTFILVSVPSLSGNLDHITPLTTMCFLLMYAGINCSCFLLGFIQAPGFRPTFRYFHWSISLIGCIWCLGLALVIDAVMALFTIALFFILLWYNHKMAEKQKDWGDVFDSVKYNVVTKTLSSLSHTTTSDLNAKNWRPQLLTLMNLDSSGLPKKTFLLSLASQLRKGKGINIVVGTLVRGNKINSSADSVTDQVGMEDEELCNTIAKSRNVLHQYMSREQLDGFAVVSATTRDGISDAIWSAVLHSGLGPISPNTVLISFPTLEDREGNGGYWSEESYLKTIAGIKNMKVALMILRGCDLFPRSHDIVPSGVIDVWWMIHEGGLLLLLPYILSKNQVWGRKGAKLRIFVITTSSTENPTKLRDAVMNHLAQARIAAEVTVVNMSKTTIDTDMRIDGTNDSYSKTVGEFFSKASYEVPYLPLSGENDIELGYVDETSEYTGFDELKNQESDDSFSVEEPGGVKSPIDNAKKFNEMLKKHSSESNLIVTNMPKLFPEFFDYVDTMCDGLNNVLLVKGSGKEVITTYA